MEEERNLIIEHKELDKKLEELEYELRHYEAYDNKSDYVKDRIIELKRNIPPDKDRKTQLENLLKSTKDRTVTKLKRDSLNAVYIKIIELLKFNKLGMPISRNQGLVIENFIFGKVIWDIRTAFTGDYGGYSVPSYYHEDGGDFDHKELRSLVIFQKDQLKSLQIKNYLNLKEFVDKAIDEIRIIWREENEKKFKI